MYLDPPRRGIMKSSLVKGPAGCPESVQIINGHFKNLLQEEN